MSTTGTFVATFPYLGGWSAERIRRAVRPELHALATAQGVVLTGEPTFRMDRTARGAMVVVQAEAMSTRPVAEVRAHAEHMAYEHELVHPDLARHITSRLRSLR